ncbi:MAG TPA: T9SS type A sorting domain-containing protein, partial [Bacteroidia bacterium]|nr:T9SS type A sorting domain-containing protein [Bacteroidia bacterium]
GSFILDVDSNRLDGRHIDMAGNIRDHFTIIKTFGPVGIVAPQSELKMTVGPNPFGSLTTVSFEMQEAAATSVRLTDAAGRKIMVFEGLLSQGKQSIVIDGPKLKLASGVYVLEVRAGEKTASRTIQFQ